MTDGDTNRQTRRSLLRAGAATACATIGVSTTTTASAETSSMRGIIANGLGAEGGDHLAFAEGILAGAFTIRTEDAPTLADRMRNEFQANREAWIRYGNWLLDEFDNIEPAGNVTVGVNVIVTNWVAEDEIVPTTINAEYDEEAEEIIDLEWIEGEPEDPDYTLPIKNSSAEFAPDDLQSFRREHIGYDESDHALPDEKYVSRYAGKYIAASRLDDETTHALGVLVGDLEGN